MVFGLSFNSNFTQNILHLNVLFILRSNILLSLQTCHLLYRIISMLLECLDDAHLVIGTKCLKRDRQFYCRIAICADKLIVFKLNDIALLLSDDRCHTHELARTIRKQYRYGKDPVSLNQSMLYDGCHCDDIHIATGENRNDLLSLYIQMLERRHSQQAGILYNHLMILNHIEEGYDQLIVTHSNDLINILLDVWEDVCSRCL